MYELAFTWKHLAFGANRAFTETYGFSGSQGLTHLEGVLLTPAGIKSRTLLVFMHPTSTLQLLPLPRAMAQAGYHVLCAASRYQKNDTALIMENVVLDLGAWIRAAREDWGYDKVVLCGWSGGGSLAMLYQSQAERPSLIDTPAGDPVDIKGAELVPADALLSIAAHSSRALLLKEWLDPAVLDEADPDRRDPELDLYRAGYETIAEPYTTDFIQSFRMAQEARMQRITTRALERLDDLRRRGGKETERVFITHRTMADPRFLDLTIDPNGRARNWCYLGHPETVNTGPVGLGRIATLRSWLSQWSPDHSRADSLITARDISVPFLGVECGADDAVPQPHAARIFNAVGSRDKSLGKVEGANHYFVNQPAELAQAVQLIANWLSMRHYT